MQEGQDPFAWLSITRHNKEQERHFEPYHTKMVSMYRPVVKKLVDGTYEVTFTEERPWTTRPFSKSPVVSLDGTATSQECSLTRS